MQLFRELGPSLLSKISSLVNDNKYSQSSLYEPVAGSNVSCALCDSVTSAEDGLKQISMISPGSFGVG